MKIASGTFLISAAIFLVSCSRSSEAKTRKEQEVEFTEAFGFSPPSTITSIHFAEHYRRELTDGATLQWSSFTFDQASFDKIIQRGYKAESSADAPTDGVSPSWWPTRIPQGIVTYSRSHDDTPENEGFSFQEYIWHDDTSGLVFFYKSYWN